MLVALIAAGNTHVGSDTPQIWGAPDVDDDLKVFGNFGHTAAGGTHLYAHTNYARKTGGRRLRSAGILPSARSSTTPTPR